MKHRDDIDWLRAIAVLAVVAFHFETHAVYGGFVGVDIFFVISGFLITQIIQGELVEGTFTFLGFYERRVRRLLPALYFVIATTIPLAFYFLLPSERIEFFKSVLASVTFSANLFFWLTTGYFDHSAVEKPLLHIWSLGVEEQFYLVFPLVIWAASRFGRSAFVIIVMATIGAASLWLNYRYLQSAPATAFFLSPTRAWEFLAGAIVAARGFPAPTNTHVRRIARVTSLFLILIPIFSLRAGPTSPGMNAIPPCLGAALYLWSGIGSGTVQRTPYSPLSIARFFGQISYSLYLWHWPVFTFARFSSDTLAPTAAERFGLFLLTVGLSYFSWAYIERPFRRPTASTRFYVFRSAAIASVCVLMVSCAGIYFSSSGVDPVVQRLDNFNNYSEAVYRAKTCFRLTAAPIDEAQCLTPARDKINVLLWGDSYAAQYYPGLTKHLDLSKVNLMQATQAGCMPTLKPQTRSGILCTEFADQILPLLRTAPIDVVLISSDWIEHARPPRFDGMVQDIRETVNFFNGRNVPVVLFGPSVQFKSRLPPLLIRAYQQHRSTESPGNLAHLDLFPLEAQMKAALPSTERFTYISVLDAVCHEEKCPVLAGDAPLTWDYAHLTVEGSDLVIGKLIQKIGPKIGMMTPHS